MSCPRAAANRSRWKTGFSVCWRNSKPDVIVLDLSRANGGGAGTIRKIRRQTGVPILVVFGEGSNNVEDYRIAGAAKCIPGPVDLVSFNQVLQQIVRGNGQMPVSAPAREAAALSFAGVSFKPHQNLVVAPSGKFTQLTPAESRLLAHFAANPWKTQTRTMLAEALYGPHRPAADRAVDVVVNRLRSKLRSIGGSTQYLIKTEYRRGYRFASDAAVER